MHAEPSTHRPGSSHKDSPLAPDDPRHGTANGYHNLGCHCQPCKAAWAAYIRQERATKAYKGPCLAPGCHRRAQISNGNGLCNPCHAGRPQRE